MERSSRNRTEPQAVCWTVRSLALLLCLTAAAVAAEADAQRLQNDIQARHLPYGTILDPIFTTHDSDEIQNYTRCGDSALWTGHYLAAQAFRYGATPAADALAEVHRALDGIERLVTITGNGLLARCAFPANSPYAGMIAEEEKRHGLIAGSVDGEPWLWIGNTSRDQYLGVFFGLTAAWNLVPDSAVQSRVAALATGMLENLTGRAWTVVMPDGSPSTTFIHRPDQQLALLKLGRRANPGRFEAAYKALANASSWTAIVPISAEVREPHDSYFKFNLDYIGFWSLLTSGDNTLIRNNYKKAYDTLRRATAGHGNAHFNLIERAINGPFEPREIETRALLAQWLARPRRDFATDLRGQVAACGDRACDPIPVPQRVYTDFLWQRSPFQLTGGGGWPVESNGLDYLLPYWMGRYYGVITD